ncbi:MAG: hypothetical protein RL141_738 [Candidatus Parcubacteria bacterium]
MCLLNIQQQHETLTRSEHPRSDLHQSDGLKKTIVPEEEKKNLDIGSFARTLFKGEAHHGNNSILFI